MRNFIEIIFGVPLFVFYFYILWPIFSILNGIRIAIFGPRLSRNLVKFAERNWAKNHPNLPKEYMSYGLSLCCDGVAWRYKDGKWQRKPKQIGLTTCGATRLPDGSMLHYEEWTNKDGKRERMEWKLPE